MNGFISQGYAADNELSPEAWKNYMLEDIKRRDTNAQTELQDYMRARTRRKLEEMKAKAKQQQEWSLNLVSKFVPWGDLFGGGGVGGDYELPSKYDVPLDEYSYGGR